MPPREYITLADRLRRLREERHLSYNDLARLSGLSKSVLHAYEKGVAIPPLKALQKLARVYQIPVSIILIPTEYDRIPK